jgi:hypothetical protein
VSNTTAQTIVQVQISSCTSHCQGVTQVQQAVQSNSTIQSVGTAGTEARVLETPPPGDGAPQSTSTISQLQLGCLTHCFGTTTADPSTAALTQLVLSELGSLLPPSGSGPAQPAPGTEQNVVTQVSCQTQVGGAEVTQFQSASQTNATVQIVLTSVASVASSDPAAVDQTQQQTWQLQVGCLFYCVDSQQVQQAQQSTTTIQIVAGGSGGATVRQTIWQVQIGCLAWCWNSTQVQQASSQSTITVLASPPPPPEDTPAPPTPAAPSPGPASAPGPAPAPEPAAASASPEAPAAPPPAPASPVVVPAAVRVLQPPRRTGLAILTRWPVATAPAPARPAPPTTRSLRPTRAAVVSVRVPHAARVPSRRPREAARSTVAPAAVSVSATALPADRSLGGGGLVIALILAVAIFVTVRRRPNR